MDTDELQHELENVRKERDSLRTALIELRVASLEQLTKDHEKRLRPLEDGQVKANTIYALFVGNGLLSIIALAEIFLRKP